jgi:ABC-type thiamin/hydroxymethylpyrimidine transport system permease subunit
MPGAIAIVFVLVIVIPVTVCMSGAIVAAVLGYFLTKDAELTHEGSELIDLNV